MIEAAIDIYQAHVLRDGPLVSMRKVMTDVVQMILKQQTVAKVGDTFMLNGVHVKIALDMPKQTLYEYVTELEDEGMLTVGAMDARSILSLISTYLETNNG